jgi:hypothetical protein
MKFAIFFSTTRDSEDQSADRSILPFFKASRIVSSDEDYSLVNGSH